ncbi:hypothetical protein HZC09_03005, partial [Candidatus Micrarchaeota archaeon]|nr:hypothetical protein [Candidatus Micrarchaeota archaeon]
MLRLINPRLDWDKRIHEVIGNAKKFRSLTVLSGFNVVTDYIARVKPEKITAVWKALPEEERKKVLVKSGDGVRHVSNHVDFLASLIYGLRSGKAAHLVASPEALKWVHDWNGEPDERRLGGQPSLMAVQLQELGANNIIYPAWLSVGHGQLTAKQDRLCCWRPTPAVELPL